MTLTFVDLFCGAGGSSTGLVEAGWTLKLAANHWQRAIETHSANHPDAEHLCADVSQYDMRRLPKADVLFGSPICTELSPAGGRPRRRKPAPGQMVLEGFEVAPEAMERTRATFWDILRAAEVWRYKAILCENVVEALDWELFDIWLSGMVRLGYQHQVVSVSSAHVGGVGNAHAPQWRDRIYLVFTRKGMRKPDVTPRPAAHCATCGTVNGVQTWRNGRGFGKYRQQYDYRCPNSACRHSIVEPYVRPAADIIDWTNLGTRIGDRDRPLAVATMDRIRAGLDRYPVDRQNRRINHSGHDGRAVPSGAFYVKNYSGRPQDRVRRIDDPLGTVTANNSHSLVTPPQADGAFVVTLRRNGTAKPVSGPLTGVSAAGNHHGLVRPAVAVEDCHFRMIQPREQLLAQRFPSNYIVHGNKGEQTMQAGNAVSVNVARWLGERVAAALDAS